MSQCLAHSTHYMRKDFLLNDWLLKQAPPDAINILTLSHFLLPSSKVEFTQHSFLSASDTVASAIFTLLRDVGRGKKSQTSARWTCIKSYSHLLHRPHGLNQPCVYLPLPPQKVARSGVQTPLWPKLWLQQLSATFVEGSSTSYVVPTLTSLLHDCFRLRRSCCLLSLLLNCHKPLL